MPTTYLTFRLDQETYAVLLSSVSEIATYPERIARVPTAPPWLRGLFSLRGSVLPALDLCARLGYESSQPTQRTCLLIAPIAVETLSFTAGMIVDKVEDLLELEPGQIEPPPTFGSSLRVECLLGTVRRGDDIVCVLDVPRMFKHEELLSVALIEERERTKTARAEEERRQLERESLRPAAAKGGDSPAPDLGRADPELPGLFLFD
jgi:purine-binding chemotaxis protein CheW